MFNRDEQHTRAAAHPPSLHRAGNRSAILPLDADAGGTWIAASDAGLAFALLNINLASQPVPAGPQRSRGSLIPSLLGIDRIDDAVVAALAIDTHGVQPFRLVLTDGLVIGEVTGGHGHSRLMGITPLTRPWMRCSSGLGDDHVQVPRSELLREVFEGGDAAQWEALQDQYHAHRWPTAHHLSVFMTRPDARTVSRTTINLDHEFVSMRYEPELHGHFGQPITAVLPRTSSLTHGAAH